MSARKFANCLPAPSHLQLFLRCAVIQSLWFIVVYGGADWLTSVRSTRVRVDFAFEQYVPFVPELILVYSSLYLMFAAVPFVLTQAAQIRTFATTMAIVTAIAGIGFLLVPSELAFTTPNDLGWFPAVFRLTDLSNLTYNLVPSLHVTYAVLCSEVLCSVQRRTVWFFRIWAVGIWLAAWLTWQHHLVDLLFGVALGLSGTSLYQRLSHTQYVV